MANLNTKLKGSAAEENAYQYLCSQGLRLIERNYYCSLGEIDLIMQDKNEMVFIEVRSNNKNMNHSLESVDTYKQAKLIKTATHFLHKKNKVDTIHCRFDVIGIHDKQIEWVKNAFYADSF